MIGTRFTTMIALLCAVPALACEEREANLSVAAVIPADFRSIPSGLLRLSLWAQDPAFADAPAVLVDEDSIHFVHAKGIEDNLPMHVRGRLLEKQTYFIRLRGYEITETCTMAVLWDGLESTAAPRRVVMQPLPNPTCQP